MRRPTATLALVVALLAMVAGLVAWLGRGSSVAEQIAPSGQASGAAERSASRKVTPEVGAVRVARGSEDVGADRAEEGRLAPEARPPSLCGTLRDEAGAALHAPRCFASATDGEGETSYATPGEDGSYAFTGLAPGRWWVAAEAEGYRPEERALDLPHAEAALREDFVLRRRASVRVVVRAPDGRSFVAACLEDGIALGVVELAAVATRGEPGAELPPGPIAWQQAFDAGIWRTAGASAATGVIGSLELTADPPLWVALVAGRRVLERRRLDGPCEEIVFVVDPSGLLARTAVVRFGAVDARSGERLAQGRAFVTNGAGVNWMIPIDGSERYEARPWFPGAGHVLLEVSGYRTLDHRFDAVEGGTLELGDLGLEPAFPLGGIVLDPDGQGVANVQIMAWRHAAVLAGDSMSHAWVLYTDEEGRFEFAYGAGRLVLRAGAVLNDVVLESGNVVADADARPLTDLRIHLQRAVSVRFEPAAEAVGLSLVVVDGQGLPLFRERFAGRRPLRAQLAPGAYVLRVLDGSGKVRREEALVVGEAGLAVVVEG